MGELKRLKVSEIVESKVALRAVNAESESFLELVSSIRETKGLINPIAVRPLHEGGYCLVDGLHRLTAVKSLGMEMVDVNILDINEAESLEFQLIGNIHRIETRPIEYAKQLRRILGTNPTLTLTILASKIGKSSTWLVARLGLLSLTQQAATLTDEGVICLNNAYALAKLPESEQLNFIDRATSTKPEEFIETVKQRIKEINAEKRQGKVAEEEQFVAVPVLRKLSEIKEEANNVAFGSHLTKGLPTALDGWREAFKWILNMDVISLEKQEEKFMSRKKQLADAREKRKAEMAQKKTEALEAKVASFQKEAEEARNAMNGMDSVNEVKPVEAKA